MVRNIILIFLCLGSLALHAQTQPAAYALANEYNLWGKSVGDEAHVFADIAYIRDSPTLNGKVIDSLTVGTPVTIRSVGYNEMLIKDFYAPWHKVEYHANGKLKQGFIWLGLIALNENRDKDGQLWLYGFNKYPNRSKDEDYLKLCEIKILNTENQCIGKTSFLVTLNEQSLTESKVLGNMGLEGLKSIYRIAFIGEACAVPSDYYYLGWTGSDFIRLPGKSTVSDAGVNYYEEKLLFPSEHQLDPNLIIRDAVQGEVIDENAEELKYKETKTREKFIWDGKEAKQLLIMK